MDIIEKLVKTVVNTKYEDLPQEAVEVTKRDILDTFGVLIAGATAQGCETIVDLIKDWGGKRESTILIHGGKVPAYNAALANSTMARALDFDNAVDKGMHPCASAVPTALAIAERCGGVSGKEFLTAIALGQDLGERINIASTRGGFDTTGTCWVFGATATAGRILGLDKDKMSHALGIAFNRAAGSFQSNVDGALVVRVIEGFTSSSGIISALLAQRGITGTKNTLQGQWGFFSLFSRDEGALEALTDGLGERFEGVRFFVKLYPSCGATLSATDAVLELVQEHDIKSGNVAEIIANVPKRLYDLVGHPFSIRENPQVDAQFSLQYTLANALVRGSPKLEHFTEKFIKDSEVLEIAKRVRPVLKPEVEKQGVAISALVEIRMNNGEQYSKFVEYPKGHPQHPLTKEEIREKFRNCVAYAPKPLPKENTEDLLKMVDNLECVEDISEIVKLLVV